MGSPQNIMKLPVQIAWRGALGDGALVVEVGVQESATGS